jgi:DNA repair exonuclease SbcCD ATPase subunit
MKISRIKLENFRQHKSIDIELDSSRSSFTILKGRNGAGKTNMLKAITWVMTGKLAKDEIEYLMSRGLDEDEATATIIRGFLDVKINGLPGALQKQIDASIDVAEKSGF